MQTEYIKGIIPPILTPIDENEKIDEFKLRKQVDFIIEGGVEGILAFGSNGEFYAIEEEEQYKGLKIIVDQTKKRVPVYFGIGAISTKKCIKLAQNAFSLGACAVSILQPMFLRPNENELLNHFSAIAQAIDGKHMLLYNNPGRIGYSLTADLVVKLVEKHENIVGIKDSSGDMTLTSELIRRTINTSFKVLGGKDTLIYGTLVHGGHGAVATMANIFPELVCNIYRSYIKGNIKRALEFQRTLNPLRLMLDKASFPVGTKDYANLNGQDVGLPYRPSLPSDESILNLMKEQMKKANFLHREN
ncbi:dihydrodipicolinate synthase family protein [Treponema sp. OMZ 840]|uniref:dihydrodipicolinate synthase family protein n=1 Tax=Treponema sp. OMZ 840 TaxID=244313 RepID=UPI003D8D307E